MGDAARAQAVASKSCLYRRNGLEIAIPHFRLGLSDWLLNLHVVVGDWPIFSVGRTKICGPSQTSVLESFAAGHGPSERQAHARNERRLFLRLMRTAATVRVAPEVRTQHQSRKLSR